jgi:hypothetical protein
MCPQKLDSPENNIAKTNTLAYFVMKEAMYHYMWVVKKKKDREIKL